MIDLSKKTPAELKKLLDSVKVSDLPVDEKGKLIEDIEYRLTGRRYNDKEVMQDILDGMAEIDDII